MTRKRLITTGLLLLAIGVVFNILSSRFHGRMDFTADKLYTLSNASKEIVKGLKEPVTVKCYFTEDLIPQLKVISTRLEEILIEYNQYSGGNVVYEFLSPNGNGELESLVLEKGIQANPIRTYEHDVEAKQTIYLGVIVSQGKEEEVIPVMGSIETMEYALTRAIKKVSIADKPKIGFISGHGEPPMQYMPEFGYMLSAMYNPVEITVNDSMPIPGDIRVATWISPMDTVSPGTFAQVDKFLARGGKLFLSFNSVDGDYQSRQGMDIYTGIEDWLKTKGLQVNNDFVMDKECGTLRVSMQGFPMDIPYPFLPAPTSFADHPATIGLESLLLIFASSMNYTGSPSIKFTSLAKTSGMSNSIPAPADVNFDRNWLDKDFPKPSFTVAGALEGKFGGDSTSKLVVVSDGDLLVSGSGQQHSDINPDNVIFAMNSIDWMFGDTRLNELRSKTITQRPLDKEISDETRIMYKYFNLLFPIGLIGIYGLVRMRRKRSIRNKRMNERYS